MREKRRTHSDLDEFVRLAKGKGGRMALTSYRKGSAYAMRRDKGLFLFLEGIVLGEEFISSRVLTSEELPVLSQAL